MTLTYCSGRLPTIRITYSARRGSGPLWGASSEQMSIAAPVRSFAAVRRPLGTCFASAASAFRPPAASTRPRAMAAAAAAVPAAKETPSAAGLHTLESLQFNNTFLSELPGDKSEARGVRQVYGALWSYVAPTPTKGGEPRTLAASEEVARLIGLDPSELSRPEFALVFSGNAPLPQTKSYAQNYGGHQFGSWAGQLGDGRAICLGEAEGPNGRWELQLKGAGKTPYSRMADGRAVLRSSLREYVASEAMAALGVPTTRALSFVATGDEVMRDMFYNGNVQMEPGAVVCRVARCFVRFGSFQLPAARGGEELGMVRQLADYVIRHHYPHLQGQKDVYPAWLREISQRTARLVAEWHRVGFVHGVLNTDNMSIIGDTIDYGPYGWLERFDPDFTPNTTDLPGRRYCFREQPSIGQFNLVMLARALIQAGLMTEGEATDAIRTYAESLEAEYNAGMARKLGLKAYNKDVAVGFMQRLYDDSADYTNTFRALSGVPTSSSDDDAVIDPETGLPLSLSAALAPLSEERAASWRDWVKGYRAALQEEGRSDEERMAEQDAANPAIVPRNHVMVDIISQVEVGNTEEFNRYLQALSRPYDASGVDPKWTEPAPKECRLGVELLSCSS